MKLYLFYLVVIPIFVVSCAAEKQFLLPDLEIIEKTKGKNDCATIFPQGNWQFVHSIDFTMGDGKGATVVGVTTLSEKSIECALITVEGLTLFEAISRADKGFEVRRAVPPFSSSDFAKGLLRNIRAIFRPPPGRDVKIGKLADAPACRYADTEKVTDVLLDINDCWQIKSYTSDLIMDRTIVGQSCRKKGLSLIPDYLELISYGQDAYTLKMTLISADNFE